MVLLPISILAKRLNVLQIACQDVLVTMAPGFMAALYNLLPPHYAFAIPAGDRLVGLIMYFVDRLIIAGFGEAIRITQRRFSEQTERLRTTFSPASVMRSSQLTFRLA